MTIHESDQQEYQATVSEFLPQIEPMDCLPTALKNIVDDLVERHDISGVNLSKSDLNELCDFREGLGASVDRVPERLSPEIKGYEVISDTFIEIDELDRIIESEHCSYPLVDVSQEYFKSVENYNVQPGADGITFTHVLIPYKVNEESILFYDPLENYYTRSSSIDTPPSQRSITEFYEWWSNTGMPRWTLWIERKEQQVLDTGGE